MFIQVAFKTYDELIGYLEKYKGMKEYNRPNNFIISYLPKLNVYNLKTSDISYENKEKIISKLVQRNKELEDVLEFYGDLENYELFKEAEKLDLEEYIHVIDDDKGYKARKVLDDSSYKTNELNLYKVIEDLKEKLKECEERLDYFDCGL